MTCSLNSVEGVVAGVISGRIIRGDIGEYYRGWLPEGNVGRTLPKDIPCVVHG